MAEKKTTTILGGEASEDDEVDLAALRAMVGVPEAAPPNGSTSGPVGELVAPQENQEEAQTKEKDEPDEPASEVPATQSRHNALLENKDATVTVEPGDVSEPLPAAVSSWEDLNMREDILKGIRQKGFASPSRVQALALPLLLAESRRDMIAQAKNGSGKTAAFALAMLAGVDRGNPHAQCLCICPTRELAQQNLAVVNELGCYTQISSMVLIPQCTRYPGSGIQILCGTPGKIREALQKRTMPTEHMRMFVLDEADVMVDREQNMAPQVHEIRKFFRQRLQLILFSATYPDNVRRFAEQMCRKPNKLSVKREKLTLDCVSQFYIECEPSDRYRVIDLLYGSMSIGQSVIFVNSRKSAFSLAKRMKDDGHGVSLICGTQTTGPERMEHSHRERVMNEFRNGHTRVLVATDVLSRGIDVPQVTLVINYDLPLTFERDRWSPQSVNMETYMHRVGRTGRFGLKGIAINLVSVKDSKLLEAVRNYYSCEIKSLPLDPEKIHEMVSGLRS